MRELFSSGWLTGWELGKLIGEPLARLGKPLRQLGLLRELLCELGWLASLRRLTKLLSKLRWLRRLVRSQGWVGLRQLGASELLLWKLGLLQCLLARRKLLLGSLEWLAGLSWKLLESLA